MMIDRVGSKTSIQNSKSTSKNHTNLRRTLSTCSNESLGFEVELPTIEELDEDNEDENPSQGAPQQSAQINWTSSNNNNTHFSRIPHRIHPEQRYAHVTIEKEVETVVLKAEVEGDDAYDKRSGSAGSSGKKWGSEKRGGSKKSSKGATEHSKNTKSNKPVSKSEKSKNDRNAAPAATYDRFKSFNTTAGVSGANRDTIFSKNTEATTEGGSWFGRYRESFDSGSSSYGMPENMPNNYMPWTNPSPQPQYSPYPPPGGPGYQFGYSPPPPPYFGQIPPPYGFNTAVPPPPSCPCPSSIQNSGMCQEIRVNVDQVPPQVTTRQVPCPGSTSNCPAPSSPSSQVCSSVTPVEVTCTPIMCSLIPPRCTNSCHQPARPSCGCARSGSIRNQQCSLCQRCRIMRYCKSIITVSRKERRTSVQMGVGSGASCDCSSKNGNNGGGTGSWNKNGQGQGGLNETGNNLRGSQDIGNRNGEWTSEYTKEFKDWTKETPDKQRQREGSFGSGINGPRLENDDGEYGDYSYPDNANGGVSKIDRNRGGLDEKENGGGRGLFGDSNGTDARGPGNLGAFGGGQSFGPDWTILPDGSIVPNKTLGPNGNGALGPNGNGALGPNGNGMLGPNGNGALGPNGNGTLGPNGNGALGPNGNGMLGPNGNGALGPNGSGALGSSGTGNTNNNPNEYVYLLDPSGNLISSNGPGNNVPNGNNGGTSGGVWPNNGGFNGGGGPNNGRINGGGQPYNGDVLPNNGGFNGGGMPNNGGFNGSGGPNNGGINGGFNVGGLPHNGGINGGGLPHNRGINGGGLPHNGGINGGGLPHHGGINGGGLPHNGGINGRGGQNNGGFNGNGGPNNGGFNGNRGPNNGGFNGNGGPNNGGFNGGAGPNNGYQNGNGNMVGPYNGFGTGQGGPFGNNGFSPYNGHVPNGGPNAGNGPFGPSNGYGNAGGGNPFNSPNGKGIPHNGYGPFGPEHGFGGAGGGPHGSGNSPYGPGRNLPHGTNHGYGPGGTPQYGGGYNSDPYNSDQPGGHNGHGVHGNRDSLNQNGRAGKLPRVNKSAGPDKYDDGWDWDKDPYPFGTPFTGKRLSAGDGRNDDGGGAHRDRGRSPYDHENGSRGLPNQFGNGPNGRSPSHHGNPNSPFGHGHDHDPYYGNPNGPGGLNKGRNPYDAHPNGERGPMGDHGQNPYYGNGNPHGAGGPYGSSNPYNNPTGPGYGPTGNGQYPFGPNGNSQHPNGAPHGNNPAGYGGQGPYGNPNAPGYGQNPYYGNPNDPYRGSPFQNPYGSDPRHGNGYPGSDTFGNPRAGGGHAPSTGPYPLQSPRSILGINHPHNSHVHYPSNFPSRTGDHSGGNPRNSDNYGGHHPNTDDKAIGPGPWGPWGRDWPGRGRNPHLIPSKSKTNSNNKGTNAPYSPQSKPNKKDHTGGDDPDNFTPHSKPNKKDNHTGAEDPDRFRSFGSSAGFVYDPDNDGEKEHGGGDKFQDPRISADTNQTHSSSGSTMVLVKTTTEVRKSTFKNQDDKEPSTSDDEFDEPPDPHASPADSPPDPPNRGPRKSKGRSGSDNSSDHAPQQKRKTREIHLEHSDSDSGHSDD